MSFVNFGKTEQLVHFLILKCSLSSAPAWFPNRFVNAWHPASRTVVWNNRCEGSDSLFPTASLPLTCGEWGMETNVQNNYPPTKYGADFRESLWCQMVYHPRLSKELQQDSSWVLPKKPCKSQVLILAPKTVGTKGVIFLFVFSLYAKSVQPLWFDLFPKCPCIHYWRVFFHQNCGIKLFCPTMNGPPMYFYSMTI